jgi:hypothetical protein
MFHDLLLIVTGLRFDGSDCAGAMVRCALHDVLGLADARHFVHPKAIERCNADGIRVTPYGAQILPARINGRDTRALLRALAPTIGPLPFRIIQKRIDKIEWDNDANPFAI